MPRLGGRRSRVSRGEVEVYRRLIVIVVIAVDRKPAR
jgi:hypothetical protein